MAKIEWDKVGERFYETGVSKCTLYKQSSTGNYPKGVPWNGVTSISESPSGAEANDLYADNIKYGSLRSAETFACTLEAYTYPDEWAECDGSAEPAEGLKLGQQSRATFGLSYVTEIGNDTSTSEDDGYLIHIVYGGTASPSERQYQTINDSPEAITFSWEIQTSPVNVEGYKPSSTITINSLKTSKDILKKIEDKIWGTENTEAMLPLPNEIISIFKSDDSNITPPNEETDSEING